MLAKLRPRSVYDVMAALALFLVVAGGSAYATHELILSSDIVDGEVKTPDIANAAVVTDKLVQGSVTTGKVKNENLVGGDIADESLTGFDVGDNSLKGADIDESTLGQVPVAALGGIGRWTGGHKCDPEGLEGWLDCAFVRIDLPAQNRASGTRVLVIGTLWGERDAGSEGGLGFCRIHTSPPEGEGTPIEASLTKIVAFPDEPESAAITAVTPPLGPGEVDFGVQCIESADHIRFRGVNVSAVAISPN